MTAASRAAPQGHAGRRTLARCLANEGIGQRDTAGADAKVPAGSTGAALPAPPLDCPPGAPGTQRKPIFDVADCFILEGSVDAPKARQLGAGIGRCSVRRSSDDRIRSADDWFDHGLGHAHESKIYRSSLESAATNDDVVPCDERCATLSTIVLVRSRHELDQKITRIEKDGDHAMDLPATHRPMLYYFAAVMF